MKKTLLLMALVAVGCGGKSDKEDLPPAESPPNVCKSLALVGTFPVGGSPNVTTYAVACFEGYQIRDNARWYLAPSKCGDAKLAAAQGDEQAKKFYEPIEGAVCPMTDVIATCDMGTAKALVYKGSEEFFKKDAFGAYCEENKGIARFE